METDQPAQLPRLIKVFTVCLVLLWILGYTQSALQRLWLNCIGAQVFAARLYSKVGSKSDCWSRGRKFKSQLSQIIFVVIDDEIIVSPCLWEEGHIVFGADPIGVSVTLSFLHNILWTSGWIHSKYSWIYNWGITKNWLEFSGLDPIFKVTAVEKTENSWLGRRGWGSVFSVTTFYSHSLPSSDSRRAVVSDWPEYVHKYC